MVAGENGPLTPEVETGLGAEICKGEHARVCDGAAEVGGEHRLRGGGDIEMALWSSTKS